MLLFIGCEKGLLAQILLTCIRVDNITKMRVTAASFDNFDRADIK